MAADKPILLGIDLGTTNTCVAYVRNKVARVVPSDKGSLILPSVVAMSDKGDLLVGNVAKDQMVVNPRNTIYGAKRLIGRQYNSKVVQDIKHYFSYEIVEGPNGEAAVVLAGKVYSLPQISAFVLQHCKRVAEATLGQEITEAIISVPAYYNDNQRNAVKEAGLLAGFNVKRIVNEPTAAALAYGLNRGFDHKVLVYDLGGGTFDVSVLQLHGNALVMDLVDKSFQIVERVLGEKNLNRGDIQEVLLVGGQTRMPLVQGKAHQFFGKPPRKGVHPDESVALGAALLAESMQEIDSVTLVDALSMPIGFAMPGGRFRKVIEKNIQIPSKSSFRLPPARDGRGLELDIFQGDSDRIIDNEYLGTAHPPAEVAGQRVNFILDEECLLHVTIESASGDTRELTLATKDTPEALKVAWQEEAERRRIDAERQALTPEEQSRGLFASIRKVFGGQ